MTAQTQGRGSDHNLLGTGFKRSACELRDMQSCAAPEVEWHARRFEDRKHVDLSQAEAAQRCEPLHAERLQLCYRGPRAVHLYVDTLRVLQRALRGYLHPSPTSKVHCAELPQTRPLHCSLRRQPVRTGPVAVRGSTEFAMLEASPAAASNRINARDLPRGHCNDLCWCTWPSLPLVLRHTIVLRRS